MANPGGLARDLDWNLIHVFVVIAEARSITDAAERLGRTQSTVSSALARLEASLGKSLVERGPRRFALTPAGRALYGEMVEIDGAVRRLATVLDDVEEDVRGHIRLAMTNSVVSPVLDRFLAAFFTTHREATLDVEILSSRNAEEAVRARRATLAICITDRPHAELSYRHLYTERFGLFCGRGHPLYGVDDLALSDLNGHAAVNFVTDRMDDVLRPVSIAKAEAGLDRRVVAQSANLHEIRRLTSLGLGIGALPVHVVAEDVGRGALWRLPPYDDPPEIDVTIVVNPRTRLNAAEALFVDGLIGARDAAPASETRL